MDLSVRLTPLLLLTSFAACGGGAADAPDAAGCEGPGCAAVLPGFSVDNRAAGARSEVLRVTLPLPPGAITDAAELRGISVDGVAAEVVPLTWRYDPATGARASIALAQLRVPITLAAGEVRELTPVRDGSAPPPHAIGAATAAWLPRAAQDAVVRVRLTDDRELTAPLFVGEAAVVQPGDVSRTVRHRGHFVDAGGAPHPLSLTVYATQDAGSDHGELVVLVGNDTLEQPVSGGIAVRAVTVEAAAPFRFGVRDPDAYGIAPPAPADVEAWPLVGADTVIADGASLVFRGRWAVSEATDGATHASFRASLEHRLLPLASYDAWRASDAAMAIGWLPEPLGTPDERRAAVEPDCARRLVGTPVAHLGYVNQAPPSTGDQPDFGAATPVFFRQAVETGSPCPLRPAALAVDREALRPSFYWMTRDGAEDRVRSPDFPELFFWSGRPHYDPSWNPQYPEWTTRASGFVVGDDHGWRPMDDQHYGNNAVRAVYALTGDAYLRELLVAHQTLVTWMAFTDYAPNLGAERSMRLMEEALALYAVEDDTPTAAALRAGALAKNRLVLADVEARLLRVESPSYGLVRNDGRVDLCAQFPDQDVVMAWQTGFNMEFQALALRHGWEPATAAAIAGHYLDAADLFFLPDGTPVTYFLESDPAQRTLGGIGEAWWAGWVQLAERLPEHPSSALLTGPVKARLCAAVTPASGPYGDAQRWQSFACP
jgi:hypothetical protein